MCVVAIMAELAKLARLAVFRDFFTYSALAIHESLNSFSRHVLQNTSQPRLSHVLQPYVNMITSSDHTSSSPRIQAEERPVPRTLTVIIRKCDMHHVFQVPLTDPHDVKSIFLAIRREIQGGRHARFDSFLFRRTVVSTANLSKVSCSASLYRLLSDTDDCSLRWSRRP